MASKIASLLGLSSEDEEVVEHTAGKLKSLTEWLSETVESLKDTPVISLFGQAGDLAKEWSGTAKVLSKLLEKVTTEHSPETIGWVACTLAYQHVAETALRQSGPPKSHVPFSGEIWREQVKRLRLEDPSIMRGFSLRSATAHPFMRAADQALLLTLDAAGYDPSERRQILRAVRASFTEELAALLTAEKKEQFAGFTQWLNLDTEDARLYASFAAHVEQQRSDLEDKPALDVEPFAIEDVYIEAECAVLPWKALRGAHNDPADTRLDPFDEGSAAREDLMTCVLQLIGDAAYNE